jgi:glycosyltransferase involved in cell wall biosynthesis
MRTLYFLLPGTKGKFACGGLWAELKTFRLAQQICPAEVVTYRQAEADHPFLPDLLQQRKYDLANAIFVISWGFDVAKLASRLQGFNIIYHAHSAGYGFKLPSSIPIITVSRNTMGYWGQQAPHSLIYYLPNQISDEFQNYQQARDIDVLVQARKSSTYLMKQLIPALQSRCQIYVVDSYVDDLAGLFNRAKVYLYDSAEYWAQQQVSEGFGLQPLEAMACGCQVFSSINGGLSDYLDPGFNCYKIAGYATNYDVERILSVAHSITHTADSLHLPESVLAEYRTDNILKRLDAILQDVNRFFDYKQQHPSDIQPLTRWRLAQLFGRRVLTKIQKRLGS